MPKHFARYVLLPSGWAENIRIHSDQNGIITEILSNSDNSDCEILDGAVIPGMPNLHSHAFQRAMAGLTEYAANPEDSFWSWRELMYKFALQLSPEDIGAIASQLYIEMLKAGYTRVGEFHYLHHDLDGSAYSDKATNSHAVINAAQNAGIGITHIPVLYQYGGFDNQPAGEGQRRFINDVDGIIEILSKLHSTYKNQTTINFGLSHHSLRAVSRDMMTEATNAAKNIIPDAPIHIHIAEQKKEVEDCQNWCGKRPVEYLFDTIDVDQSWCLVHATHMTKEETDLVAKSGSVAGLCPTTEGNLGDGLFNLPEYINAKGNFGIGSDSHVSVSVSEELRLLEYGQRLKFRRRNIAHSKNEPHIGAYLYKESAKGGAQALGIQAGEIKEGSRADFVVLNDDHPLLYGKKGNQILDSYIFAGNANLVRDVYVHGKIVIRDGYHAKENIIADNYKITIEKLLA